MRTFALSLLFLLFIAPSGFSQGKTSDKVDQLATIQRDLSWLEQQVAAKRSKLAHASTEQAQQLEEDLTGLELRLDRTRNSFISVATDVELPNPEDDSKPKKRDLVLELQQLVEPLFDAVQRVSEKPRRIETYRTKLDKLTSQLALVEKAVASLDHLINGHTYPALEKDFKDSRDSLSHTGDELQVRVNALQRKLDQELSDHRTVREVFSETLREFFSTKGRDLLLSSVAFGAVFWFLLLVKKLIFRSHRVHRRLKNLSRAAQILYNACAFGLSLVAMIVTLHLLNDWFLVSIIMVLLVGAIWSSKALIAHFVAEGRLALNLGPVRQGERVVWQGVPWLVKSLGYRSVLANEALQGGVITLPASVLLSMFSRATVEGEPWFPTHVGDMVLLDDGNFGKVETQTPESVVLNCDGTRKHYSTSTFLSKNPQNFSRGFALSTELTLPLPNGRRNVPELTGPMHTALSKKLDHKITSIDLSLYPAEAGQACIVARADCPGELAPRREALQRGLHVAVSEAWNELGA